MTGFRSVEEHVQGADVSRPLPGGGAGQPDRRHLDGSPRETEHAAQGVGPRVHRSVGSNIRSSVVWVIRDKTVLTFSSGCGVIDIFDMA